MQKITSIKDEMVVFARSLQHKSERIKTRSFLVEGRNACEWVLSSDSILRHLFIHDKIDPESIKDLLGTLNIPIFQCSEGILKKITGTSYLIPLVGVAERPAANEVSGEILIVFDGVQDFGNIGTIVRTASAFGIHHCVSTSDDFDLFQRKTIDASRGAVFTSQCVNFSSGEEAARHIKAAGYQIVATALEGSTIQSLVKLDPKPTAIVFGNESQGVSRQMLELADVTVQIPMATAMDSLNVGVAAGISLYEIKLKVVMMMLNEKIRGSLGRNLFSTSTWLRRAFNRKLEDLCNLSADQAIILMILVCDEKGEKEALMKAAGILLANGEKLFRPLINEGYLFEEKSSRVEITEKGKELLGKIWNVHESTENLALKGFTTEDRQLLSKFLKQIQDNLSTFLPYE